ncbi:MAG: BtaA family protein, partial [Pyrinomonadaceae bacterium]|nr:BtaA family protein [Pyrinomonadaceae bacterium]
MSYGQELLLDAVKQEPIASRQGVMQKMFAMYFDGLVYNQIWEDPRVDLKALQLNGESRVLSIASGGCNALNYLKDTPESVTAADLNPHHIYLTNLKIAALRYLPTYDDFFAFFGTGEDPRNVDNYHVHIAQHLDAPTREFWEDNLWTNEFWFGARINYFAKGFYNFARNGYFLRFFHRFAKTIKCDPSKLIHAKTLEEQKEFFEKSVAPFFDSRFIKTAGKLPITMFGLGIPPQQYNELKKDADGNIIALLRERVRHLCCDFPIQDNYFAWQGFARKYDTENRVALPDYLKEENYEHFKQNAYRVKTVITSVTEHLREQPKGSFNRFVFLDAQDWMTPEIIADLWRTIAERGG